MPDRGKRGLRDLAVTWLRRLVLAILGVYLFYLIVFNGLFWSGAYEALINRSQNVVYLRIGHAWTVRPFVVEARDLRIIVDDPAVQLDISVDEVEVGFHVLAFKDRTVHMHDVRGGDFRFRMRRRVSAETLTPRWASGLPPMPLVPPWSVPDPTPDHDLSNNWNVRMDDIDVRFTEIWIDSERFVGKSLVTGGFTLETEKSLELTPSRVVFEHGSVFVAQRLMAADLSGEGAVTLERIDLQNGSLDQSLSRLHLSADLESYLLDAGAFAHHLPEAVRARGGRGTLRLKGALSRGTILGGSALDLDLDHVVLRLGPLHVHTPIALHAKSDGERLDGRLELGGALGFGPDVPTITISQALLTGGARAANLRGEIGPPSGKLDLQGGTRAFRVGGDGPQVTAGVIRLSTQLELEEGVLAGALGARIEEADLRWGELAFVGGGEARFFIRGGTGPLRIDNAEGEIEVKGDVASDEDRWDAKLVLTEAEGSRREGRVAADLTIESLGPFLEMPALAGKVPGIAEALLDLEDVTARLRADWNAERLMLTLVRMECDSCSAAGRWRIGDGPMTGAAIVQAGPARVGVVSGPEGSNTTIFPGDDWKRRHLPQLVED